MGFIQTLQSKKGKKFMGYLYGWGASIVIVGAMFKIQHWPGAGPMLVAGLSIEAIIFFFSAFEPVHVETDWSLVYPELAGMHDDDYDPHAKKKKSGSVTQELDKMLEEAKIGPELLESLGSGLKSLGDKTAKLADITDASVASNEFSDTLKNAAKNVSNLSDGYNKAYGTITGSIEQLDKALSSSSKTLEDMSNFNKESQAETQAYKDQLHQNSKNLAALNAVYELQLQSSNEHLKATNKLYDGIGELMQNLNDSVSDTKRYKSEVSQLAQNLSSLNTVYGNMLSAMNFNK